MYKETAAVLGAKGEISGAPTSRIGLIFWNHETIYEDIFIEGEFHSTAGTRINCKPACAPCRTRYVQAKLFEGVSGKCLQLGKN